MSVDARSVALQGLVTAVGGTTFITGEPSADIVLALSAEVHTQIAADLAAETLSANIDTALTASLSGDTLTSEEC